MEIVGHLLDILGLTIMALGGVWLLFEVFRSGIAWFLVCLFIPVTLFWLLFHWEEGKRPFALMIVGLVVLIVGFTMAGGPLWIVG